MNVISEQFSSGKQNMHTKGALTFPFITYSSGFVFVRKNMLSAIIG